jgi:hypothetical protein
MKGEADGCPPEKIRGARAKAVMQGLPLNGKTLFLCAGWKKYLNDACLPQRWSNWKWMEFFSDGFYFSQGTIATVTCGGVGVNNSGWDGMR